jgi:hypothetical protein
MNEHHPLDTSAPIDQPLLTHLASATNNMQHLLINLVPTPLNVNELNPVNIQVQAAIKPLWLDFPKHHMKSSLSLLSVKELSQAACKSPSLCQVNRKGKDFQIDTILSHFHTLSTQYELLNKTHKSFWGLG